MGHQEVRAVPGQGKEAFPLFLGEEVGGSAGELAEHPDEAPLAPSVFVRTDQVAAGIIVAVEIASVDGIKAVRQPIRKDVVRQLFRIQVTI